MQREMIFRAQDPADFPNWRFSTLEVDFYPENGSLWMSYKADGPPYFSLERLQDVGDVRKSVRALYAAAPENFPVRYFLMASKKPGVFNVGGDLELFAKSIRANDRDTLRLYAHACTELVHSLAMAFDLPMVTLSVIAGQALGGGLEGALAEDFVVAEENARIGVPEVAFNTFPGMGAVTLLARRVGSARADEIISTGTIYAGQQMYDEGVVDVLARDGEAFETTMAWMSEGGEENFRRRLAIAATRRRLFPVSQGELDQITDLWVDCSCDITAHDIRYMQRLAAAQKRAFGDS